MCVCFIQIEDSDNRTRQQRKDVKELVVVFDNNRSSVNDSSVTTDNSLRFVGLLPPLDAPHYMRKHEWAPYREECFD
ncbi:hypothetical protein LOK49_LG05G01486 [Camellia lanceoleosa]|uniref:Uncharacterized protein n=1 Tax=Camellia lanceoleosa TaxID=1840588 RepID=A0ACC0HQW1_9ERIC|nr:hypothetical protein LOK49_LG05G01486 [Camellia lanceoleosa]